ncbi:transposase [Streptomyces sp. NPDC050523]|uniref:IS110 family transposase n=1 Tax=Streptomyces sp. NPDC050523 TaxID=3365622 RepID=UPI00379653F3
MCDDELAKVIVPQIWAGEDISKEHHHCVVVGERGERLFSRRVFNDEPALLELIANVLALSEDALMGGGHQPRWRRPAHRPPAQPRPADGLHHRPGRTRPQPPGAARARLTRRTRSSSPTWHAWARTSVLCGPATR